MYHRKRNSVSVHQASKNRHPTSKKENNQSKKKIDNQKYKRNQKIIENENNEIIIEKYQRNISTSASRKWEIIEESYEISKHQKKKKKPAHRRKWRKYPHAENQIIENATSTWSHTTLHQSMKARRRKSRKINTKKIIEENETHTWRRNQKIINQHTASSKIIIICEKCLRKCYKEKSNRNEMARREE